MKRSLSLALFVTFSLLQLAHAQPAKLSIVNPDPGQQITGSVEIRVTAEGKSAPKRIYVGIGKTNWREMERVESSGEWVGTIDTTLVPNGDQLLRVITENKKVRAAVVVNIKNPLKVFFSDLHSHTSYSDGVLIPSVAHEYARDVSKLNVFCLTDHLESVDDAEWTDMREVAWDANQDGHFVAFPGLEWTKKWGHINIYDPKTRHWPDDPTEFYQACADARVVAKFNHPGGGAKSHGGLKYSEVGDKAIQLMEVRKLAEEKAYIHALNQGWHIAPDGSDDTHGPNWGNSRAWSGILASGLSRQNILDAMAKRHCYSTLDRNCLLRFRVNGATMGDILTEPVKEVNVSVRVGDPDKGDLIAKIELFEDGEVVDTNEPKQESWCWNTTRTSEPGKHYYFVKVTQADGNRLWSAPVWVTVGE